MVPIDADPGRAVHLVPQGGHVGAERVELGPDAARPVDHDLAFLGDRAGGPVDEGHAELPLEPRDVGGDVRLHRVERAGPGGEAAVVGHGQQRSELSEVHRSAR